MTAEAEHPGQREMAERQLENGIAMRSAQDQVLWSIFGAFWGSNAILLVALFQTGDFPRRACVGFVIALVGTAFALLWAGVQARALHHIERHESVICSAEMTLRIPDSLRLGTGAPQSMLAARNLMRMGAWLAVVVWAVAAITFACRACSTVTAG